LQSYHDLAVRLEPIILELEREQNDLLIVAHESVLRVLYGYLMACGARDIPKLQFPRDEIIEVCSTTNSIESSLLTHCAPDCPCIIQQRSQTYSHLRNTGSDRP
jgi:6-phosphofructo-2-kinase/fructose-2,6-biphosphatase 4